MDTHSLREKLEIQFLLGLVIYANLSSTTVSVVGHRSEVTSPVIFRIQGVYLGSFVSTKEIVRNDFEDKM